MSSQKFRFLVIFVIGLISPYLLVSIGIAGNNTWTTTGPYGARIGALVVDPTNNENILATILDSGKVFKSTDGGQTWQEQTDHLESGWRAMDFAFDPNNPQIVYLATGCGLYRSTDKGDNWERTGYIEVEGTDLPIKASSVAISPLDSTIFVGGTDGTCFTDPLNSDWIFKSADGGQTWERVNLGVSSLSFFQASALVIAPSAPHIIYASSVYNAGILKSTDGGTAWESINNGFVTLPSITALSVDPYDSQVVYMGTSHQGVYKTTDGGSSWVPIGSGLDTSHISSIVVDPGNQQVIYLGGGDNPGTGTPGVYRSLDNLGLSWSAFMEGMGSRAIYSMAIDGSDPLNIYAGTQSGIWKYTLVSGPADYSVTVNDSALFTNQTTVTLTMTAPSGTTEMIVSNDGGFNGAIWEPFAVQRPWIITEYGSHAIPRIVYAKFKTNGQISGLYQDDIILDVTAPTGSVAVTDAMNSSMVLGYLPSETTFSTITEALTNTVYLPVAMHNARPGYKLIGLTLSATDDLSGVGEMQISHQADFTNAEWEEYVTRKNWWAPDTDSITIYVKYRDRAGNESIIYSDVINP